MALFLAAPLVLGVPHLLADVRYLVVRPGLHARRAVAACAAAGVVVAMVTGVAGALVASSLIIAGSHASAPRRAVFGSLVLALAVVAISFGGAADVVFAHLHNLVAVAFFIALRPREPREHRAYDLVPVVVAALLAAVILTVPASLISSSTLGAPSFAAARESLAPGVSDAWATRLVVLFVFGQSVHYAIWLRLVPEVARPSETPRSFRQTLRALVRELGVTLVVVAVLATAAFVLWGALDASTARTGYVRIASFHGYGEIILGALFATEARASTLKKDSLL